MACQAAGPRWPLCLHMMSYCGQAVHRVGHLIPWQTAFTQQHSQSTAPHAWSVSTRSSSWPDTPRSQSTSMCSSVGGGTAVLPSVAAVLAALPGGVLMWAIMPAPIVRI